MERAVINGAIIEHECRGSGDAVVFIHGALIADAFAPMARQPALADQYRLISFRRRGYGGSGRSDAPLSVEDQAADCLALLRHLGLERAHVIGHSYGGSVALQMGLQAPSAVLSVALLEPALIAGATADSYRDSLVRGVERYRERDPETVVDEFLEARSPGYRGWIETVLPGAFAQALADAGAAFECDVPGLLTWRFGEREARRISQPALCVLGGESTALWPRFGEVHSLLLTWLPRVESVAVPGATHLLHMEKPAEVAEALMSFYARQAAT